MKTKAILEENQPQGLDGKKLMKSEKQFKIAINEQFVLLRSDHKKNQQFINPPKY